jgi:Cys-tRNA(Pro)/Cys-tRNA(Cys) deacylase
MKTNAMRILESERIPFETASYDVDEECLDAVSAAQKLGVSEDRVFKTIVMRSDANEIAVFCVSARSEVNLKKARAALGAKEVLPIKSTELLALTGYIRGGCSPIGMKKRYRTFIDETAVLHDTIYVSAGVRGTQVILSAEDLARACGAEIIDVESR